MRVGEREGEEGRKKREKGKRREKGKTVQVHLQTLKLLPSHPHTLTHTHTHTLTHNRVLRTTES